MQTQSPTALAVFLAIQLLRRRETAEAVNRPLAAPFTPLKRSVNEKRPKHGCYPLE